MAISRSPMQLASLQTQFFNPSVPPVGRYFALLSMYGGLRTSTRRETRRTESPFGQKPKSELPVALRKRLRTDAVKVLGFRRLHAATISKFKSWSYLVQPGTEPTEDELVAAFPPPIKLKVPMLEELPWDDWRLKDFKSTTVFDGAYRLYWHVPTDKYSIQHYFASTLDYAGLEFFEAQTVLVHLTNEREKWLEVARKDDALVRHFGL